ncbi:MAG: TolB family protein [Pyrinomonadaceae bacterium]
MRKEIRQEKRPARPRAVAAPRQRAARRIIWCALVIFVCMVGGCRQVVQKLGMNVQPRALRDVPAARLAFRLETDIGEDRLPENLRTDAPEELFATIKTQFETNRKDEALLRTVVSPDGLRALALYDPGGTVPIENTFRIDLYGADGMFVRNLLPPNLEGITLAAVAWSPDAQSFAFIGREKPLAAQPSPTPDDIAPTAPPVFDPNAVPTPTPSVAPFIAPVPVFKTDQIYFCDRDGNNLRPLTTREGLIYLSLAWSPDSHALAALASKQDELDARLNEGRELAGRPRIIERDGRERLLDDQLMDVVPVWSPDSTKVATASETDVAIYDVAGDPPTGARLPLRDPLFNASVTYDATQLKRATVPGKSDNKAPPVDAVPAPAVTTASSTTTTPLSFNPVIRLEWVQPETLLVRTGFLRYYQNSPEPTRGYLRWHILHLSPQAAVLN